MGMIDRILSAGGAGAITAVTGAAADMAEVFTPNATRALELEAEAQTHALSQFEAEFAAAPATWFDSLVNGLNRLPRPLMTLGTIGLFGYAMVDPAGFSQRMQGLALVPEPLWWLMGAIVSFYFGAREAWYFRRRAFPQARVTTLAATPAGAPRDDFADNAALRDWASGARM